MSLTVDSVTLNDNLRVVIAAKTAAETTAPIALRDLVNYTLTCSTLGVDEEVLGEIYDASIEDWQPWMVDGDRVKFAQDYEQITISNVSCFVRFIKPITANPVGLTMSHR